MCVRIYAYGHSISLHNIRCYVEILNIRLRTRLLVIFTVSCNVLEAASSDIKQKLLERMHVWETRTPAMSSHLIRLPKGSSFATSRESSAAKASKSNTSPNVAGLVASSKTMQPTPAALTINSHVLDTYDEKLSPVTPPHQLYTTHQENRLHSTQTSK